MYEICVNWPKYQNVEGAIGNFLKIQRANFRVSLDGGEVVDLVRGNP